MKCLFLSIPARLITVNLQKDKDKKRQKKTKKDIKRQKKTKKDKKRHKKTKKDKDIYGCNKEG